MKEIIKSSDFVYSKDDIIAYETKDKNGLAILTQFPLRSFGFIHHSELVRCRFINAEFIRSYAMDSIKSALNSGKIILVFDNFREFYEYSAKFVY